jgi:hypothetical protein
MIKNLFYTGIASALIYTVYNGSKKYLSLQGVEAQIDAIKSINISNGNLIIAIDLKLINNTSIDFNIDTFNLLKLKKLKFFNRKNKNLIGISSVSVSSIEIPKGGFSVLKNLSTTINISNLFKNLSLFTNGNINENLSIVPVFNVIGKDFEVNPDNFS